MVPFQTVEMQPAWEALGMNQEEYQEYLDGLPLGRKYALKRAGIEQGVVERAQKLLALPEKASDHASATSTGSENEIKEPEAQVSEPVPRPSSQQAGSERSVSSSREERPDEARISPAQPGEKSQTPVHKELITYLEHVAAYP